MFCIRSLIFISTLLPQGFCSNDSFQWDKENEGGDGRGNFLASFNSVAGLKGAMWGGCVATGSMSLMTDSFPQWSSLLPPASAQEAEVSAHPKKLC